MTVEKNKSFRDFEKTAKNVFNTDDGKRLLRYLQETYVNMSSVTTDVHLTMYNLGKKELIQDLVYFVNEPEELNDIEIVSEFD